MTHRLSRRTFLAGAHGTAVALPFLEIMMSRRAYAQGGVGPTRYFVAFGGTAIGADGSAGNNVVPVKAGVGYDLPLGLSQLGGKTADASWAWDSVQNDFSVVSGLKIPWDGAPGGRVTKFHASSAGPLLCGVRGTGDAPDCLGPSSDQLVADALGAKEKLRFPSLNYRVQLERYNGAYARIKGYMSFRKGAGGNVEPNTPIVSPRVAYNQLFEGFTAPSTDPKQTDARALLLEQNRSVLDVVSEGGRRLLTRLGTADKQRLQRHFDELRELERRLGQVPNQAASMLCRQLQDPGVDPATQSVKQEHRPGSPVGYAGEVERAKLMVDLVHMAFTCNLTRVATLLISFPMSFMSVEKIMGRAVDLHDLGHGGGNTGDVARAYGWHVGLVAQLADKLKKTPEGSGNLLDRSVLVLVTEAGFGFDPEQGAQNNTHSTENMVALVGGRAGGLKPGKHVVATGRHPASVLISAMTAAGAPTNTLGDITGGVSELSI